MSKINDFMKPSEQSMYEKLTGVYGCKYCSHDVEGAWWDESKRLMFWTCPDNHRSEQQFV